MRAGEILGTRARVGLACVIAIAITTPLRAAAIELTMTGTPVVVYDSARNGCTPDDVPDISPRAYRDAAGGVTMFTLHFENRALRGPDLLHLAIDCRAALHSALDGDPSHYDDRSYIASTWTTDGTSVSALVHHEYHADHHGRCRAEGDIACWYNSILAYRSSDGGRTFAKAKPLVVASAPFTQDVGQGRHRGFFAPSNMVSADGHVYVFGSTTGWDGQPYGACLFRTATPEQPASWRAYDGRAFTIAYGDPYSAAAAAAPKPCEPIAPFTFPVSAIVRHRASGLWIAVLQASKTDKDFPVDGIYYATATDLRHWSAPRILIAGQTIMSDLCKGGAWVIGYPSVLDAKARSRNFEDVGDTPDLYVTKARVSGCGTAQRLLLRQPLRITSSP